MANNVKLHDYTDGVKLEINETTLAWLHEAASEVTSHAQRNCVMKDDAGKRLKGSYNYQIEYDSKNAEATVGTPLEEGYWEEFGTGEHADVGKNGGKPGRQGWWVYVKGEAPREKVSKVYRDKVEAEAIAESMRAEGLDAYATNGRDPNYTLEKAFEGTKNKAVSRLKQRLKEMGK